MRKEIIDTVDSIGIDAGEIDWEGSPREIWKSVMTEASRMQQLRVLLEFVRDKNPPLVDVINGWLGDQPPRSTADQPVDAAGPAWKGFTDDGGSERQIVADQETLLDVVFLAIGLDRARSVCHLKVKIGKKRFVGTGFRIADGSDPDEPPRRGPEARRAGRPRPARSRPGSTTRSIVTGRSSRPS